MAEAPSIRSDYLRLAVLCMVSILYFVWPIPHTISLRQILFFLLLIITCCLAYKSYRRASTPVSLKELKAPAALLAALTLWMLIVAVFISDETARSLGEITSVWGFALLALILGGATAVSFDTNGKFTRRTLLTVLFLALLAHVLLVDLHYFYKILTGGVGSMRMLKVGLTYSDKATYLSNTLFALLSSEAFFRLKHRERYLPLSAPVLALSFLATLFSLYVEAYRFGTISMIVILIVAFLLYLHAGGRHLLNRKTILLGAVILSVLFSSAYLNVKKDPRWESLIETVPLALDTENSRAWLDSEKYPYPKLSNGEQVIVSNYERIAWFKEGLTLVRDNPLGIGFGRDAFELGLQKKYGEGRGHSHSGFVDLAVGIGVPGLLLWLSLLGSLLFAAFRAHKKSMNFAALLMILLVSKFSFRMMVDSIIRDHMLQQFFFVVGVLCVMMLLDDGKGDTDGCRSK